MDIHINKIDSTIDFLRNYKSLMENIRYTKNIDYVTSRINSQCDDLIEAMLIVLEYSVKDIDNPDITEMIEDQKTINKKLKQILPVLILSTI